MKQNTLPRTMHACETMGVTSVICTDKTGTLTQNQMQVYETAFAGLKEQKLGEDETSARIKECIAVNTTANLDFSEAPKIHALGNPTEGALLLWLHKNGVNYLPIREEAEIMDRLPFTTELKYMATIVRSKVNGKRVLYVKGAPEIVMGLCTIRAEEKKNYDARLAEYQSKAMRTLSFACQELADDEVVFLDGKLSVHSLQLLGIVAISDPVREDVPAAIKDCLDAGIQVKIVTGDTTGTAKEIGRQVGLWTDADTDENILIGQDIETMTDAELEERLPGVKIIARARPNDKERIVRTLKRLGYVVAVTGDGTNDAPALNAANVGLSMGDGTAVAKEASDMTIMDNSFSTIANAVMWGRSLYKNIKRFILFQMTINVVACLIVLIGAFIGTEAPLTVTQMLWVNLIMDTFAALALASLPPTRTVMSEKPRPVDEHILKGMGKKILGVGLAFTIILLAILLFFQHTEVTSLAALDFTWGAYNGLSAYELGLFFTIFVMLQFWNLFNAKAFMTNGSAFKGISWKNTKWFILITIIIFAGQVFITETPGVQEMFNVAKGGIKRMDWLIIIAATSLVLWIGEVVRWIKKK
jgi:Ca2+-transporting ATPase